MKLFQKKTKPVVEQPVKMEFKPIARAIGPLKKLSEMNGEELAITLCNLSEPAASLFGDPDVTEVLKKVDTLRKDCPNKMQFLAKAVGIFAPVILGDKHREDVFAILAVVRGVDVKVIREQNGLQTVREIVQLLFKDFDAMTFFRPAAERTAVEGEGNAVPVRTASDGEGAGGSAEG